jgi:hypothetical protein
MDPLCGAYEILLIHYTLELFQGASVMDKIHYSMSCAIAVTHLTQGKMEALLMMVELVFMLKTILTSVRLKKMAIWTCIVFTYSVCNKYASVYLVVNAYFLMRQIKDDARSLSSQRMTTWFYSMIRIFSEIIKFTSFVHFAVKSTTATPLFLCFLANLVTSGREGTTSTCLLVHAAVSKVPPIVLIKWWSFVVLNRTIKPLYGFSMVSEYAIDALFYLRLWHAFLLV